MGAGMSFWAPAFRDHKPLLLCVVAYCVAAVGEGLYFRVPVDNLMDVARYIALSLQIPLFFLVGMYAGSFFGYFVTAPGKGFKAALQNLDAAASRFVSGPRFAYGAVAFLAMQAGNFFLITKSLIPLVNPYSKMHWDIRFSGWDRLLHFSKYPHQWLIPLVNKLHLALFLDRIYYFWFLVMTAAALFNVFGDSLLHRRLRYLWSYVLAWILLGTFMAAAFSSVGPVFFNMFFREEGGPYDSLLKNTRELQQQTPLFSEMARRMLIGWVKNDKIFDINAISAMPSMHVAISWLIMLYAREIGRWYFIAAAIFCASIFAGSIYYGLHYALDGYVAVAGVTLIWWMVGKCLDRRYPRDLRLQESAA